jgi:multidrug resistance protein, MATE family
MQHTQLTPHSFGSYAALILSLGLVSAGFGAVDMMMVAPLGLQHVAAVGQGDVLAAAAFAFFMGLINVVASRLAVTEGGGDTILRLSTFVFAFVLLLVPCALLAIGVALTAEPLLRAAGQHAELVPLIGDYLSWRMYGAISLLTYFMCSEALKICGIRGAALQLLVFGFIVNASLNWVFLHSSLTSLFQSPEGAVAAATVVVHTLMAIIGAIIFWLRIRQRSSSFPRPTWSGIAAEVRSVAKVAPGVGMRHLNDYAGTVVPLLFIGTLSVEVLAAAHVATKIYVLFCRVPQACFGASFAYYGYAVGENKQYVPVIIKRLALYSAIPTAIAVLLTLAASPWIMSIFASPGMTHGLVYLLLVAYMWFVPAYFFEHLFGEMLTVHQRGNLLFVSSTAATYMLTIPISAVAVFTLNSAFLAIACKGIATTLLALVFWRALCVNNHKMTEVR